MRTQKINYTEGTCFIVPLRDGAFARGVVCRLNGKGIVFGRFYGPRILDSSGAKIDGSLSSENAVLTGRFGDLGLINGAWKIVGVLPDWQRDKWPLPAFVRGDAEQKFIVRYSDDLQLVLEEKLLDQSKLQNNLPEDGLMGYGFVELRLTRLLNKPV